MTVQRFKPVASAAISLSEQGEYVKYEDYADLAARMSIVSDLMQVVESPHEEVRKECEELVADNAALKAFGDKLNEMHNDLNGEGTGIQGRAEVACQQAALEAAMEEFDAIKTPATDAFLAELRAQGADECVRQLVTSDDDDFSDAPNICAMVAHQLRKVDAL